MMPTTGNAAHKKKKTKKKKRKARDDDATAGILEVSGLTGDSGGDDLASCLEELESTQLPTPAPAAATPKAPSDLPHRKKHKSTSDETAVPADDTATKERGGSSSDSDKSSKLWDRDFPVLESSQARLRKVIEWNTAFHAWTGGGGSGHHHHRSSNKRRHDGRGRYTAGLLPSLDVELCRHFQIKSLSSYFLQACPSLKMPPLERWILDSKVEEQQQHMTSKGASTAADPVLSRNAASLPASQRLVEEIAECLEDGDEQEETRSTERAEKFVKELCRRTNAAIFEIQQQSRRCGTLDESSGTDASSPLRKGDRIELEMTSSTNDKDSSQGDAVVALVYHRKKWKKPFRVKINRLHYEKTKAMFLDCHNNATSTTTTTTATTAIRLMTMDGKPTMALHSFHLILMVLVLRYSSLSGGQLLNDLRGGGMQGAIHQDVFDVLRSTFSASSSSTTTTRFLECFASPFNCFLPSYGSAFFDDIDFHFGSVGDFLTLSLVDDNMEEPSTAGHHLCCEANPPFSPGLMNAMVDHMQANLERADEKNFALTFVVIVPSAESMVQSKKRNETKARKKNDHDDHDEEENTMSVVKRFARPSFLRMTSSEYCQLHIVLSARQHGYVEGAQHMRPTRYKDSYYDTSVILLQSATAVEQTASSTSWDKKGFEKHIRAAFQSRHAKELASRRRIKAQAQGTAIDSTSK